MHLYMKSSYRIVLQQIALAPAEFGVWGPLVSERNAYAVDSTKGNFQVSKSKVRYLMKHLFIIRQAQVCWKLPLVISLA
jgi:hypothetical protein